MSNKIDIGLVGLGWVSTHRHIPALKRSPHFRIAGVADLNEALAREWGTRLGVPWSTASDIDGIEWVDQVQAIDVVTAPMSHHALIRDALARGRHVITEKPFATSVAEGEELVALSARMKRSLAIVHNFQFASAVQRLEHDIALGRIGTVRSIVATQWGNPRRRLPSWYEQLPGGLFFDESPHLLYLIRRLSPGPLSLAHVDVCPSTLGLRTPASIDASFRATTQAGEIPVTVACRFEAPLSEWHVAVLGDAGAGIVDVFRNIYLHLPNDGAHVTRTVLRTSWRATAMHWIQHLSNGPRHLTGRLLYGNETVFDRFGRAIKTGEAAAEISADDALEVLRMQFAVLNEAGIA
ncbi:Gfo/Idh/MocA family protein [Cognatilysobacter bugurensis]|uniref:Gfo/Idh/MocA-like oxidoreductase N-terminal domain-containing protein n=1 Tax=Cognatilysobacter bugurensis TaxID=543356 RepID=A0A918W9I6_9GAMM|nr:Gfo/Idh/MocA family oxidoreductase [Lysobacter bugurensis]GHA84990.1 hypothetical protein GCM10007067_23670 [Lysobacter bugurensis]